MNEEIINLKRKIVKPEDFFRDMADAFIDKTEFGQIHFLMPDIKTHDFSTAFSTNESNIKVAKKDLVPFNRALGNEIFSPRKLLWEWRLWKQIHYFKVIWKIYIYDISAIMPIQGSNGICCLIVFCNRHAERWFNQNTEFAHTINQHILFCLEAIRLYNQTLEGIIRKYDPSYQRSARHTVQSNDEQIPALVERKVEFL